jgi:signal transduction histidine kinase
MKIKRPYSLQSRFIIGLIGIIFLISIINLSALFYYTQLTLEKEVATRAAIVLQQVDAVQNYVRKTLRPRMFAAVPDAFILEAMSSSYISRAVMERHDSSGQDYLYRRVAIHARNPQYEANKVELELINHFRGRPDQQLWQGRRRMNGEKYFIMARPVVFTSSCLACHGRQEDAPAELRQQYGNLGFGHHLNSIDGIDLVGVPIQEYAAQSNSKFVQYVLIYLAMSAFILLAVYLTFQRLVAVNIQTLTSHFRRNFSDDKAVELLRQVEHGDEIEEIIEGMEGLSQHLYEARQQLSRHAADLEIKVKQRTEQLSQENQRHRRDLNLFVAMLRSLRQSRNRPQLWRNVLPLLQERFQLQRSAYICTFSSNLTFSWPWEGEPPPLPDNYVQLLEQPRVEVSGSVAYVPVGGSDETIEGLLVLERPAGNSFSEPEVQMLQAVGRQLGIAAENLAALDSILRQSENLQTIFEGIGEPLLLMDKQGTVIMANSAAGKLQKELACQHGLVGCLLSLGQQDEDVASALARASKVPWCEVVLDNGRSFFINIFSLNLEESGGDRFVVAIQEDTQRKKMLKQMVHSEKMATVGKLAAGLAHELNNPLGVILCYAELLKKALRDEQQQDDIDVMIRHTKQAQAVLSDLLNFARPTVSTCRETVVGDVVQNVSSVFQVQANKKGVSLRCRRNDEQTKVRVEPQLVEHIVLNLLLNALDAVEDNRGVIDLSVEVDHDKKMVCLRVEDNGCGIDKGNLELIFDPFFSTKEIKKGTGLGLAVIYGYMHELGGTVQAGNRPEGGAYFDLHFPIAKRKNCENG